MNGTVAFPIGASLNFSPDNRSRTSFTSQKTKASIRAAVAEIETRKRTSLYEVLKVEKTASPREIKTAYRSLAKMYHPDALRSEEPDCRDFIEIHNAYAMLSDPNTRAVYDLSLCTSSGRRRPPFRHSTRSECYPTRRWETDQCW